MLEELSWSKHGQCSKNTQKGVNNCDFRKEAATFFSNNLNDLLYSFRLIVYISDVFSLFLVSLGLKGTGFRFEKRKIL